MNTKSFRREMQIGVGGFVASLVLSLAMFSSRPSGIPRLQAESRGSGWNHVAVLSPSERDFILSPRPAAASVGRPVISLQPRVQPSSKPVSSVVAPPVVSVPGQHPYHLIDLRPVAIQPKN